MPDIGAVLKVMHIITDLTVGGAEMVLLRLLSGTDGSRFTHEVVSLGGRDELGSRVEALGWPVAALGMGPSRPSPRALYELTKRLRQGRPDVVQTWMYHADLLGGLAARFVTDAQVVWGVHQTDLPADGIKFTTRAIARVNSALARLVPDHVVFCSQASADHHLAQGYGRRTWSVIPNGFEIVPEVEGARRELRSELGVVDDTPLVVRVGRFHPQKDHRTFIEAARLTAGRSRCHFVFVGQGLTEENTELRSWIERAQLAARCHLLGLRNDIDRIHAGADVAVSSSAFGEAFPLVLGEAMMQGTPVVATDVGDSALIVGDTGRIVPPRDPGALATALVDMLEAPPHLRNQLGENARRRVVERFSLERMVSTYEDLYTELAARRPT